ncbi:MAG TPA: hypothetical protein PL117_09680 [Accumulibacter sp.]|uniref:hypothetical protein n=1 Tax=Accumulibacter sp. TaxID=2053492 RepID=UPI002CCEA783|nr:hypothetical protein [Accumulibacter sp.]HRF73031.1 hypothetical protein [Accumulibacter sp.]
MPHPAPFAAAPRAPGKLAFETLQMLGALVVRATTHEWVAGGDRRIAARKRLAQRNARSAY